MCALTFYYLYVCLLFDLIAPECCFILLSMYYLDATCFFFFFWHSTRLFALLFRQISSFCPFIPILIKHFGCLIDEGWFPFRFQ